MNLGSLEKLSIVSLDDGTTVTAQYNPNALQIDRTATFNKHADSGKQRGQQLEFTGQEGRTLGVELFFDSSEGGGGVASGLAGIEQLAKVRSSSDGASADMRRPHHVAVVWGTFLARGVFKGVIESYSAKLTMFDRGGNPIRATVTLKLKEAESVTLAPDKPPQAPPSQSGGVT